MTARAWPPDPQAACGPRACATWLLWLSTALLLACAPPPRHADQPVAITVLHTNDHHGRFWRGPDGEGGMAARQTVVDAVRSEVAAAGGHVLLLDAGDVNTGTPESTCWPPSPTSVA